MWNLIRWVSPRTIKETFVPPTDYRYPFMGSDGADRPAPALPVSDASLRRRRLRWPGGAGDQAGE